MATTIFEFVSEQLQSRNDLGKLEARGSVRLARKESGLDPHSVSNQQIQLVLDKVLPTELAKRGVQAAAIVCSGIGSALRQASATLAHASGSSPEEVFRRLAHG